MRKPATLPVPNESAEQKALIAWWARQSGPWGYEERLLMAIPNGGARNAITGARLRDEGVRAGAPDMFLAVPANGLGGLWIELKRQKGGRLSEAQEKMLACLAGQGYAVTVCHGFGEAMAVICRYLGKEPARRPAPPVRAGGIKPWLKWGEDEGGFTG